MHATIKIQTVKLISLSHAATITYQKNIFKVL